MPIQRKDCIELGYISKAHGLRGEVKAVFDVHDLREYLNETHLLLAKPEERPTAYEIKRMNILSEKQAIIKFKETQYRDQAEALRGSTILFPKDKLPALEEGRFYYFQITGYQVIDQTHGALGPVTGVWDGAAQDVLIFTHQEKEILLPITDEFVLRADHEKQALHTSIPAGLLETYLEG